MRRITSGSVTALGAVLVLGAMAVTVHVQREAPHALRHLGGGAVTPRALVLFHPSRDAHFSDDLAMAVSRGLLEAGLSVDLATITRQTPVAPDEYAIVVVVANTYWWAPDRPTLRYLQRARMPGLPVLGLIGGAGSTGRSERLLAVALGSTGAHVVTTRAFWLWRPNDEARSSEPNREVALDLATRLGRQTGAAVLTAHRVSPSSPPSPTSPAAPRSG